MFLVKTKKLFKQSIRLPAKTSILIITMDIIF